MKYDFDERIDRTEAISIKWSKQLRKQMFDEVDIIPMGIADMDFKVSPAIARAVQNRASHETYGYGYPSEEYLQACVDWQKRRNNWEIQKDWIVYTPGVNMALVCAIEMYAEVGDRVIVQSPVYYPYYDYIEGTGRKIAYNPLVNKDDRYEINYEGLENLARDEKTKLMILCSPHNPVGRCWSYEELLKVGQICNKYHVMVAVDEIHSDLILQKEPFVPYATVSDQLAQNCIICTSPSKTFNLAGLLVSDIIIPNESIRLAFKKKMAPYYLWPGNFGAVAQIAAYNESEDWLEELLIYLRGNAEFLYQFTQARMPEVKCQVPQATYLAWMDFSAWKMSPRQLWDFMLHRARVAPDNGQVFGPNGEGDGFQRINFACPRAQLKEALERIADARDKLNMSSTLCSENN